MYELFILGELFDTPMHGYLLHSILVHVLGPLRQVSWGSLYMVLRRLEESGDIEEAVRGDGESSRRPRKVYRITPPGRRTLLHLMERPLEHTMDTDEVFRIKLSKFHVVSEDVQRNILQQYKVFIEMELGGAEVSKERVMGETRIPDAERPHILSVIDYEMVVCEARLRWVDARLDASSLD